jgi:hypothetical protein
MNVSKGIIEGTIDAGIGLENIQQVEVSSHWNFINCSYQMPKCFVDI